MKRIVGAALLLASFHGYTQSGKVVLKDDLLGNKDAVMARHLPMANGTYLYRLYAMTPVEFMKQMEASKNDFVKVTATVKDSKLRALQVKDADYNSKNVINTYTSFYGMDSLGIVKFHEVVATKKEDDAAISEAHKNAFLKKLSPEERTVLVKYSEGNADLNDEVLFTRSKAYRKWLDDYIGKLGMVEMNKDTTVNFDRMDLVKIEVIKAKISNPFIREYLHLKVAGSILKMGRDPGIKAEAYRNFMALAVNPVNRAEMEVLQANDQMMNSHAEAPGFAYQDVDNKVVSLKSLGGKYVYIDVWATWCAPCKAEIPYLSQIEKDYHGRNIHFVSLSVDKQADSGKWRDYVKTHQLGGIQLIADQDFKSEFVLKFNINAIPRFILIDPAGKIVSGDAHRPSDPALRKQLDELLR